MISHLGIEKFREKGWCAILEKIVRTYNITPHKGINFARPWDLLLMKSEALEKKQKADSKTPFEDYLNKKPREQAQIKKYLNRLYHIYSNEYSYITDSSAV